MLVFVRTPCLSELEANVSASGVKYISQHRDASYRMKAILAKSKNKCVVLILVSVQIEFAHHDMQVHAKR